MKNLELLPEIELSLEFNESTGQIHRYLDRSEHIEPVSLPDVHRSALSSLVVGCKMASLASPATFTNQIASVLNSLEQRSLHHKAGQPLLYRHLVDTDATAQLSWLELQVLQNDHDTSYHPDVVGGTKRYHLEHTAGHLSSTAGKVAGSLLEGQGIEDRQTQVLSTTFTRGNTANHVCAVSQCLFTVERTVFTSKTLANHFCIFVNKNRHFLFPFLLIPSPLQIIDLLFISQGVKSMLQDLLQSPKYLSSLLSFIVFSFLNYTLLFALVK